MKELDQLLVFVTVARRAQKAGLFALEEVLTVAEAVNAAEARIKVLQEEEKKEVPVMKKD